MRKMELHPRTAIINKKQKNQSKNARLDALRWLAVKFPNAFDNSLQIRPLKSGIMEDVLGHADEAEKNGISKSKLREAVVVFTRRIDYLTALKARDLRVDLNGEPVSEVTEEEAERAAVKIKRRVEKSAKNARKTILSRSTAPAYKKSYSFESEPALYGFEREPAYSSQPFQPQPPKAASVVVKNKSARQLDPDAVARLKEKLGLSRKKELS